MTSSAVEMELGVPIPGVILPEEQWARTALKKWPAPGTLDCDELFGRAAPLVVDIGCGNGRSTLLSAVEHPEWNLLAVDVLPVVIRYATRRANQRGLAHVRFGVLGGRELLWDYLTPGTVTELHGFHPQPYYERRQHKLRLITPEFLARAHAVLVPGGKLLLQTDNPAYARYMRGVASPFFTLEELPGRWPNAPQGRTRREIIALREGLPVYRAIGTRRDELSEADITRLVASLPRPTFDADRRLAKYDRMELDDGARGSADSASPSRRARR